MRARGAWERGDEDTLVSPRRLLSSLFPSALLPSLPPIPNPHLLPAATTSSPSPSPEPASRLSLPSLSRRVILARPHWAQTRLAPPPPPLPSPPLSPVQLHFGRPHLHRHLSSCNYMLQAVATAAGVCNHFCVCAHSFVAHDHPLLLQRFHSRPLASASRNSRRPATNSPKSVPECVNYVKVNILSTYAQAQATEAGEREE